MPKKALVLKAGKAEAKLRRLLEFEDSINSGKSVSGAAEAAGLSYMEARRERAAMLAKSYSGSGVGLAVVERGAFLLHIYLERLEEIENEMEACRARLRKIPQSAELGGEYVKLTRELREMFAERAAHEERVAALGSHIPTLGEVREVERWENGK